MALDITFLGHAGFLLSDGTHTLAVDPFLTGNPVAPMAAADITCDSIAITHAHDDHFGDCVSIATANNATVIANFEIGDYLAEQGVETNPGNPGGTVATDFGSVSFTHAIHSSSFSGRPLGVACGLVIAMGGVTLYHLGDTDLFSDLALIGEIYKPDIACVPIGDRFTMGPALGARAAELVKPKVAIPMHYNTWPPIEQDVNDFAPGGMDVKVMTPGETWRYEA